MHALMQCFQTALAYSATAVSYAHKMFMKLIPDDEFSKLFFVATDASGK